MTNIYTLLLMSVSGTLMYLLSLVFGKRTKYYVWQYAMLVTAVIMLLVPIQKILEIPRLFKVTVPQTISIGAVNAAESVQTAAVSFSAADIIAAVWLAGAAFFTARMVYKYIKTALTLKQITEECYDSKVLNVYFNVCQKLSIRRSIKLSSSKYLNSPLLFGIVKPTMIIPGKAFSQSELEMILTHELTHYRHRDLWIALAASAAQCVHWFNPAVYFIGKSISETCELFCDETVVKSLSRENKKAYGILILSVIEKELNSKLAYTTSMASAKNSIQKRLKKIVEFKMPTKASVIAGIMAVFACVVSSLTAFGFETAAEVIPEEVKRAVPSAIPTAAPPEEISAKPITEPPIDKSASAPLAEIPKNNKQEDAAEYESPHTEKEEIPETDVFAVENEPKTSYIFNADFSGSNERSSETFKAESGTKLSISKISGSKDVTVSVHNAATGEVIYDERADRTHVDFSMSVPESGDYYVKAYSEKSDSAGIYIYGE